MGLYNASWSNYNELPKIIDVLFESLLSKDLLIISFSGKKHGFYSGRGILEDKFSPADIYIYCISEWKAVEIDEYIPWDLEATPLQIKTDTTATVGSEDYIYLNMYDT